MTDDYRSRCRDCVHRAPWPERDELARESPFNSLEKYMGHKRFKEFMSHPVYACMAEPRGYVIPLPRGLPDDFWPLCPFFKRGRRSEYIKEVENAG